MKMTYAHSILTGIGCLFLSSNALQLSATPTLPVESVIEQVSVYPDSAKIHRSATVQVESGESFIRMDYLPYSLDAADIRASILSETSHTVVRDVVVMNEVAELKDHPKMIQLETQREVLLSEIETYQSQISLLKSRLKYAEALSDSFTENYGNKAGSLPPETEIQSTWEFYEKTYWEVESKLQELKAEMKPKQIEVQKIASEIGEFTQSFDKINLSVGVLVEAPKAETLEIGISYLVRNCSWQPVYEIRANPESDKVTIRYQVSVYQNSGEDWENVALTLSTAKASTSTHVPELYPITLNKLEPVMMRKQEMSSMDRMVEPMVMEAAPMLSGAVDEMEMPAFEAGFSSYQVTLPQSFTMTSGKERKKSLIAELELDADFWTVVVPKYDTRAYLTAEVENGFEMPMLPGKSILFVEDQLVGKSFVENTPVGSSIELSLGLNENISVERISGKQNEADRGIFGKRTRINRQYFTTLENNSPRKQRIVVKDQIPVSQNEKIEVSLLAPEESMVALDPNTGEFSWDFELDAKASKTLETHFDVLYPEDWNIPKHF